MKKIKKQRKNYLNWNEYFMAIAKLSAMRSKDPSTQVGACIVGSDNRILSIGYNGAPNGFKDDYFPWERQGDMLNTKYAFVCHAEMNAIISAARKEMLGGTLFLYGYEGREPMKNPLPCTICRRLIKTESEKAGDINIYHRKRNTRWR